MNTLRSPAPAASLFNVGQFNRKNNGMFGNAMNAANTAVNTVANAANTAVASPNTLTTIDNKIHNSCDNWLYNVTIVTIVVIL